MNPRSASITLILAALFVASPFAAAVWSDGSTADTDEYDNYYRGQLNHVQQTIYDGMSKLDPAIVHESTAENYYVTVTVNADYTLTGDAGVVRELMYGNALKAWQASFLDNPYAWWTWSTDDAAWAIPFDSADSALKFNVNKVDTPTFTFNIRISEQYGNGKDLAQKVQAAKDAVDKIVEDKQIKTEGSVPERVESINSFLTGESYEYDDDEENTTPYRTSVYGAFVHKTGDVHKLLCTGFSQAFRALCEKAGVRCTSVVGTGVSSEGNEGHMWNVVDSGGSVYGNDITWNLDSANKKQYLMVGYNDVFQGITFGQTHQAFSCSDRMIADNYRNFDGFHAPVLKGEGYDWPREDSLVDVVISYAPWIVVAVICVLLAYVLWSMGKKGE